jgi:ribokinase
MSPGARICILGSINADLIVRTPRLPGAGETVLGGPFTSAPGGKGANQAVAAARMGAHVTMIGAVGDDAHGRAMLGTIGAEGVDATHVKTVPGAATGVALITVEERTGENTIVVAPGANAAVTPADVAAARGVIGASDILLVQLETPLATVRAAAELAGSVGTSVVLNAAPAQPLPLDLLAMVDVLVVNESEAATLAAGATTFAPLGPAPAAATGRPETDALLARLATIGPGLVVLTLGAAGAVYQRAKGRAGAAPPYTVEPTDTVGAGDAFTAALAVRWAEQLAGARGGHGVDDLGLIDTLAWACAAGALATTKSGAIPSLPTRAEVMGLLRR